MGFVIGHLDKSILEDKGMTVSTAVDDTSIYGVTFADFDPANNKYSTVGTRTDDAVGYNFEPSTLTYGGVDDFVKRKSGPFNIRECVTVRTSGFNHEVVAYKGDPNWDSIKTNSSYNRMIEFPKFYYYRPDRYTFLVSSTMYAGFLPSPMHYRDGVMLDKVYLSKYQMNTNGMSQTGTGAWVSSTLEQTRAKAREKGCYLFDAKIAYTLAMLCYIKYANMDAQACIGVGYANSSGSQNQGVSDSILSMDGRTTTTATENCNIVCLGIENLYGHNWTRLDGMFKNNDTIYIADEISQIVSNPNGSDWTGYTAVPTKVATSSNWQTLHAFDSDFPYLMFPIAVGGNESQSSRDYYYYSSGLRESYFWDFSNCGSQCGLLCLNLCSSVGHSDSGIGASFFHG